MAFGSSVQRVRRAYHSSCFFHFSLDPAGQEKAWSINSFPQSHVSLDREIETIL
jgi:hypothetical protein